MPSAAQTNNKKAHKYRTLVLIIGVLVALVIGLSLTASAFDSEFVQVKEIGTNFHGNGLSFIISMINQVI